MVLSIEEHVFLLNTSFEKAIDIPYYCRSNLLKNSQKHLYLIAIQFIDLLRNFVKQAVLDTVPSGRPSKINDKKLDISDSMLQSQSKSLHKLAQKEDIGLATVHKVVREKLNLFPYKIKN
jgi:hypothetical protein